MNMAIDSNTVAASLITLAPDSVEAASAFNGSQPALLVELSMAQKHWRGLSFTPIAVHFPSPVSAAILALAFSVSVPSVLGPHLYVVLLAEVKCECKRN